MDAAVVNKVTSPQQRRIVELLKAAGLPGAHMSHLNAIAYNYTARISDLRRKGFVITKHRIGKSEFKYTLDQMPHEVEDDNARPGA